MTKTLIARHDLERIALQEIRSFPGCEHVTVVEVEHQIDRAPQSNWTLHVFTREGGDMQRIQYAINATRKRLRQRYDLRLQSSRGKPSFGKRSRLKAKKKMVRYKAQIYEVRLD